MDYENTRRDNELILYLQGIQYKLLQTLAKKMGLRANKKKDHLVKMINDQLNGRTDLSEFIQSDSGSQLPGYAEVVKYLSGELHRKPNVNCGENLMPELHSRRSSKRAHYNNDFYKLDQQWSQTNDLPWVRQLPQVTSHPSSLNTNVTNNSPVPNSSTTVQVYPMQGTEINPINYFPSIEDNQFNSNYKHNTDEETFLQDKATKADSVCQLNNTSPDNIDYFMAASFYGHRNGGMSVQCVRSQWVSQTGYQYQKNNFCATYNPHSHSTLIENSINPSSHRLASIQYPGTSTPTDPLCLPYNNAENSNAMGKSTLSSGTQYKDTSKYYHRSSPAPALMGEEIIPYNWASNQRQNITIHNQKYSNSSNPIILPAKRKRHSTESPRFMDPTSTSMQRNVQQNIQHQNFHWQKRDVPWAVQTVNQSNRSTVQNNFEAPVLRTTDSSRSLLPNNHSWPKLGPHVSTKLTEDPNLRYHSPVSSQKTRPGSVTYTPILNEIDDVVDIEALMNSFAQDPEMKNSCTDFQAGNEVCSDALIQDLLDLEEFFSLNVTKKD